MTDVPQELPAPDLSGVPEHLRFEPEPLPPGATSPVFALRGEADGWQTFTCYPRLPGTRLFAHYEALDSIGSPTLDYLRELCVDYFRGCLPAEQYERFHAFADNPANQIEASHLRRAMEGVHREYLSRPTKGPSPSPDGPETTGDTSTDVSPFEDSTQPDSTAEGS